MWLALDMRAIPRTSKRTASVLKNQYMTSDETIATIGFFVRLNIPSPKRAEAISKRHIFLREYMLEEHIFSQKEYFFSQHTI